MPVLNRSDSDRELVLDIFFDLEQITPQKQNVKSIITVPTKSN